jgi:hypothetical protein
MRVTAGDIAGVIGLALLGIGLGGVDWRLGVSIPGALMFFLAAYGAARK